MGNTSITNKFMFPNKRVQFIPVITQTVALCSQQSLRFYSSHLHNKHMTFIDQIHLKQATRPKEEKKKKTLIHDDSLRYHLETALLYPTLASFLRKHKSVISSCSVKIIVIFLWKNKKGT